MARRIFIAATCLLALMTLGVFVAAMAGPNGSSAAQTTTSSTSIIGITTRTTRISSTTIAVTTTIPRSTTTRPSGSSTTTRPKTSSTTSAVTVAPLLTTTTSSTTTTTIAAIGGRLPNTPNTVPLRTKGTSAHVSPVFAMLSGIGFFLALVIMAASVIASRPRKA